MRKIVRDTKSDLAATKTKNIRALRIRIHGKRLELASRCPTSDVLWELAGGPTSAVPRRIKEDGSGTDEGTSIALMVNGP